MNAIHEEHAPTYRDVSNAVADVRSGVIIGYTRPEKAAEKLHKIIEEYADLATQDQIVEMFKRVSTTTDVQPRIDEALRFLADL